MMLMLLITHLEIRLATVNVWEGCCGGIPDNVVFPAIFVITVERILVHEVGVDHLLVLQYFVDVE